jgi:hypothetical protein
LAVLLGIVVVAAKSWLPVGTATSTVEEDLRAQIAFLRQQIRKKLRSEDDSIA